jgi:hypothetical protein
MSTLPCATVGTRGRVSAAAPMGEFFAKRLGCILNEPSGADPAALCENPRP